MQDYVENALKQPAMIPYSYSHHDLETPIMMETEPVNEMQEESKLPDYMGMRQINHSPPPQEGMHQIPMTRSVANMNIQQKSLSPYSSNTKHIYSQQYLFKSAKNNGSSKSLENTPVLDKKSRQARQRQYTEGFHTKMSSHTNNQYNN